MIDQNILDYLSQKDVRLSKVIRAIGQLDMHTYNQSQDSFLFLVREIVGQMISSSVKKILVERLLELCGGEINPKKISSLKIEDLRGIGLSNSKSKFILNLASSVLHNEIDFAKINSLPDEQAQKELMAISGIGHWTSKMYLIFFLQRENVLPFEDGAFLQAYRWLYNTKVIKPDSIARKCKAWSPYTSIGARYLYRALDTGLTKIPIKEFLSD